MSSSPRCRRCGGGHFYLSNYKVCQRCFDNMADPYRYSRQGRPKCKECGRIIDYMREFKVCTSCYIHMDDPWKHVRGTPERPWVGPSCPDCGDRPASQFSKRKVCGKCMMSRAWDDAFKSKKQRKKEKERKEKEKKKSKEPEKEPWSLLGWLFR